MIGLYLVPGVDESQDFCVQTQGEVFQFAWFRIQDLWKHMKRSNPLYVGSLAAKFVHVRSHRQVASSALSPAACAWKLCGGAAVASGACDL